MRHASLLVLAILVSSFLLLAGCSLNPTPPPAPPPPAPTAPAPPSAVPNATPNTTANASANATNASDNSSFVSTIVAHNETEPNASANQSNRTVLAPANDRLEMLFVNVGEADATLLREGNLTILIDTGSADSSAALIGALRSVGVSRLDLLVLTTFESDKIGGLPDVLRGFHTVSAWHDGSVPDSPEYVNDIGLLQSSVQSVVLPQAGQSYAYGPLNISIFNPQPTRYPSNPRADSIAMRLAFGKFCAFLPGDTTDEEDPYIVSAMNSTPCPVYKWRYHGEGRPTPSVLYDRLQPRDVVISVGPNSDGLPSPTTLQRLNISNATVWRTDQNGSIYLLANLSGDYAITAPADLPAIGAWYAAAYPAPSPG
ncbi:MAG: MBL fold metallo-hydrolase [Candidatus Micrarchaeota archaeon]|nr:MBL fold metallo-hydrolase [Candidatus Micrarchaeota archaeon]